MVASEVESILLRADETLRTAYSGLEMMKSPSGVTRNIGLRNVITFARSVTFVLQNLAGKHPRFEEWYKPHQLHMKNDKIFSFFRDARNNLEKQGRLETAVVFTSLCLDAEAKSLLEKSRPPGAKALFFGDSLGGSGWMVALPNGDEVPFYVTVPEHVASIEVQFSGELTDKYLAGQGLSVVQLSEHILGELSKIVDDARSFFLEQPAQQKLAGRRLPPFIRVVK